MWEEGAGPPEAFSLWRRREWLAPRLATDQFFKLSSFFQGNPGNDGLPGNPGLPEYIVSNRESRRRWRLRSSTACLFCLVSFVFTDQCYKGTKHLQQCFIKNLIKKKQKKNDILLEAVQPFRMCPQPSSASILPCPHTSHILSSHPTIFMSSFTT